MDTLSISQARPALEIRTTPAKLNITNRRPVLRIKRSPANMHITKKKPTFKVNWRNVHSGVSAAQPVRAVQRLTGDSLQKAIRAVGMIARSGNTLVNLEGYGNPIGAIAADRAESETEMTVPSGETLAWEPGYFKVEWSRHITEIEWDVPTRPEIKVEPHSVKIKVVSRPEVSIKVRKGAGRSTPGTNVDKII